MRGKLTGQLDRKATADKAESLLLDYQHHLHKAERGEILHSIAMDGMPKSQSYENTTERAWTESADDQALVSACNAVLKRIDDVMSRAILDGLYMHKLPTVTDVMDKVGLEHSAFYVAKEAALIAFAEKFPPECASELLVYS